MDRVGELATHQRPSHRSPRIPVKSLGNLPEFLNGQRSFPSTGLPPESAKASVSRLQNEPDGAPKHFLLAALYAAANENALSDSEWKSFEAGFSAWQQAQNAPPHSNATSSGDACRTHHYSRCIDLLQARKPLTDSERLLLGKTHFALQQYELAADALGQESSDEFCRRRRSK